VPSPHIRVNESAQVEDNSYEPGAAASSEQALAEISAILRDSAVRKSRRKIEMETRFDRMFSG
jgi:hypothetical protein